MVERGKAKAHPPKRAKVHGEESKAAILGSGTSTGLGKKKKALVPSVVASPGAAGNPERSTGRRRPAWPLATAHGPREAGADGQALPVFLLL